MNHDYFFLFLLPSLLFVMPDREVNKMKVTKNVEKNVLIKNSCRSKGGGRRMDVEKEKLKKHEREKETNERKDEKLNEVREENHCQLPS